MNSLSEFPSVGGVPFQAYSPTFYGNSTVNPYSLSMPSLNVKPKSTIGCHNGYPTSSATTPTTETAINNDPGYSTNRSNISVGANKQACPMKITMGKDAEGKRKCTVQNLPQSMLKDQYGIAGLFVGRKVARHLEGPVPDTLFPEVLSEMSVQKADSANEPLCKHFSGPLSLPVEPESFSTDVAGPGAPIYPEYLVTQRMVSESREPDMNYIRKTWALKIDKFGDDLLFYVFYTFTRDILQIMAANNLYQKGWRFHMEAGVWLQRIENGVYATGTDDPSVEKGVYKYFDFMSWKTAQMEMVLDTNKLEGPPQYPPSEYFLQASPKT